MQRARKLFVAKSALILSVIPVLVWAYSTGPDPGKSGVPGESTCAEGGCHVGTGLNAGPGSVSVAFPGGQTYAAGVKQHLVVTVADSNQRRWGFQLTARQASDAKAQAGTFTPTDGNTQVVCATPDLSRQGPPCNSAFSLLYIEHTEAGARTQAQSATFEFDWTPPSTDVGPVVIYVAGNAANGNQQNTGDRIYTNKYTLSPGAGGGAKPTISQVINGASFLPGIAPASWVTIKGSNLANIADPGRIWRADEIVNGKLPTSLDGVSVAINGKPAYVYYISQGQINVQSPSDTNQGPVNVVVTNNGQASDPATAQLGTFSPGFFQYTGSKYAIATRNGDNALIADPGAIQGTVGAKPGDVLILWATGFGPTNPDTPAGQVVAGAPAATTNPTILVGGSQVKLIYSVLSPGSAGLFQIAIELPATIGPGDQSLVASIGGVQSASGVNLFIAK